MTDRGDPPEEPAPDPADDAGTPDDDPKPPDAPKLEPPKDSPRPRGKAKPDDSDERPDDDPKALPQENVPIDNSVTARNLINGDVRVGGDYIVMADGSGKRLVSWIDITLAVVAAQPAFVEPPNFAELNRLLATRDVVVLTGGGCGNRTAAGAALHVAGCKPIFELPAGDWSLLIETIKEIAKKHARAGILIESLDTEALMRFTGYDLRELRSALSKGGLAVLTTRTPQGVSVRAPELCTLEGVAPDAVEVVRSVARTRGVDDETRSRALSAAELLEPPVAPALAVEQPVDLAQSNPDDSPEKLSGAVAGGSSALETWVGKQPTAAHVASLTAAAVLDGLPSADVDARATRLERLLVAGDEVEAASEQRRFGLPARGWPDGVVGIGRGTFTTHFGHRDAEVIQICPPHRRDRIVTFLWKSLGGDFRVPFIEWLRALPEHSSDRVCAGAAIAAGVLFADEPVIAERELLRAWGLDGRRSQVACAGMALGVPVVFGEDPAPARALTNNWVTSQNLQLRRVAIEAYGGLLGAWDTGAAAAQQLWRVGGETPALRRAADVSLAALVAAGADAGLARATTLSVIAAGVEQKPDRRRSYELLPLVVGRLCGGGAQARESFAALLSDAEHDSLEKLASVFARAFDAPMGHASATAALRVLLDGLAASRIERGAVNGMVRAMKDAARPGRRSALGSQIERVLMAEGRRDNPRSAAAHSVHGTFYQRRRPHG